MNRPLALLLAAVAASTTGCGTGRVAVDPAGGQPSPSRAAEPAAASDEFDSVVRPILHTKCMPCHFEGGKMYASLPFDRPETIRTLGEKLFTRIKDEESRTVIRAFLAQPGS